MMTAERGETLQTIRTERLSIRRVAAGDWKAIQAIWADAAQSEYARYDKPNDTGDGAVSRRIARWASFAEGDEHMFFAVCLEDAVIGYAALNRREEGYELGYCFHSAWHGKGYARESIAAILNRVKERGAHRIEAGTALKNQPSVRLLQALGFRQTGTEPVSFYRNAAGKAIVFEGGVFELTLREEPDRGGEARGKAV